ncbi:MAG: efflux transporter outer membrane subunit [Proteobacteria bacterium]|nr:efflux transporter outer membrane subunit [Pseudomonadota bacterium]
MTRYVTTRYGWVITVSLAGSLLMSGCSLLPRSNYTSPHVALPQQWQGRTTTGSAIADREQWWKNFNDPVLDELIGRALRTNNDLAAAAIKVRRAQLTSRLTDTNLTPSVSGSANSGISRDLNSNTDTQTHSVTGTVSYEIDLWGKLAGARDASRWEAEATEVDRQSTALSLIGTTAADYWQIAYLNQLIATSEASIAYAEKTLELVTVKYQAGAVSAVDLVQAQQSVASQRADLTTLLQQRMEARTALTLLFDQAPENSMPERQQLPDSQLPAVKPGLPASLLSQRPDLRAAELRLREYLVNVDTTRASYYPSITLTGSLGSSSTSLANILQNPVAALGAGVVLPFLQWNTMQLNVKISETAYEEAVVNFRQTLYAALGDVEKALSAHDHYEAEGAQRKQALALAQQAEQLAEIRYRAGYTGVQLWLDAQESRRNAENTLAGNRLNRLKNMMTLYQALGGDMKKASKTR